MGPINLSRAALPAAVLFIFLSIPALAQDTQARSKPRFHGFALKVHGVKTSPWTWTRFGGAFQARQAGGLGLNVSYAPVPSLAAYVAADLLVVASEYLTGWTTYEAGVQMRLPLHPLLMPYTSVGLGHLSSLNNFPGYNFATFGVGVESSSHCADSLFITRLSSASLLETVRGKASPCHSSATIVASSLD